MYFVKTPAFIKTLFSDYVWSPTGSDKVVHLTFDDGPVPEVTNWVLDLLAQYNFKATFFCVGENVIKNKDIFDRIISEGHSVGNHTFNHLNGWKTDTAEYLDNVSKCNIFVDSVLFRPPYGKLTPRQAMQLKKDYTIVMWDILSGDFDKNITPEKCLQNVLSAYENGSVIVFHDSIKAMDKLKFVLPVFLKHLSENGYRSENLSVLTEDRHKVLSS
ncbi:MAG: polysaccharide deacetylase family protein [Saprospiraceae bacterium]|nr:polysaccharide deacetylase family protein [Saprospiraceae bacterium]